jgi:hypothetical protein
LRANEAKIMQETKALYAELSALKRLLAVNGIPLPEPGSQAYSAISQDVTSPEQTFNSQVPNENNSRYLPRDLQATIINTGMSDQLGQLTHIWLRLLNPQASLIVSHSQWISALL